MTPKAYSGELMVEYSSFKCTGRILSFFLSFFLFFLSFFPPGSILIKHKVREHRKKNLWWIGGVVYLIYTFMFRYVLFFAILLLCYFYSLTTLLYLLRAMGEIMSKFASEAPLS